MSIALLPTLFAAVLFGPLAAGLVNAASMLGDPELFAPRDPDRAPRLKWASYTSSRIPHRRGGWIRCVGPQDVSDLGFWWTSRCDTGRSAIAESLDILSAGVTQTPRSKIRGVLRTLGPLLVHLGASLCACRGHSCACLHRSFPVDCAAVLHSGPRCSTTVRDVPAAALQPGRRPQARKHVVCRGARRDARSRATQYTAGHQRLSQSTRETSRERMGLPLKSRNAHTSAA